jgi:hypothetical protein
VAEQIQLSCFVANNKQCEMESFLLNCKIQTCLALSAGVLDFKMQTYFVLSCRMAIHPEVKVHAQHVVHTYMHNESALQVSRLQLKLEALKACLPAAQGT